MASDGAENVYTRLGARPVINAGGNTTVWGGSTPSPAVLQAMLEAGNSFVAMEELLEVYRSAYQSSMFIRLYSDASTPQLRLVNGSNFCDIHCTLGPEGRK